MSIEIANGHLYCNASHSGHFLWSRARAIPESRVHDRCDIGFSPLHPTHQLLKLDSFARHPVKDQDVGVLC